VGEQSCVLCVVTIRECGSDTLRPFSFVRLGWGGILTGLEEQTWEPRRIRIPRVLVWAILLCFMLLVVVISIWGLARGTWGY
jgi:hypothetical protein